MAHIITFGNEKGGAGKSTLAIHVTCALLESGVKVGILDLDLRQLTLRRFFENRFEFQEGYHKLALPHICEISNNTETDKQNNFHTAITTIQQKCDYIVIDCPGALTAYSELAHIEADTLVTPLNDSFIDFDLLAQIDPNNNNSVKSPSVYAEMVWNARKARAQAGKKPMDWAITRNRLSTTHMHNKRKVGNALNNLSKRIGFRIIPGLSDRVIFKELFPKGLTILDSPTLTQLTLTLSNVAARQEIRDLITELRLKELKLGF